jgi:hypothetical protein
MPEMDENGTEVINAPASDIVIKPTAPAPIVSTTYTDIASIGLLNAHISIINTATAAIWSRYNVMLIANSFLITLLNGILKPTKWEIIFGTLFGVLLCIAWWAMTSTSWKLLNMRQEIAARFTFERGSTLALIPNPMKIGFDWRKKTPLGIGCFKIQLKRGPTYTISIFVILLYMSSYLYWGYHRLSSRRARRRLVRDTSRKYC